MQCPIVSLHKIEFDWVGENIFASVYEYFEPLICNDYSMKALEESKGPYGLSG